MRCVQHKSRGNVRRYAGKQNRKQALKQRAPIAHRQRVGETRTAPSFYAIEDWYEATGRDHVLVRAQQPGDGYIHAVTLDDVRERLAELHPRWTEKLEVVQFSRMTRKRRLFPCYGMQWGSNVYLYPIEESLREAYVRPPRPQQIIEAKMYGGVWSQEGPLWILSWTPKTIRDFYLNNVLIHEIGHVNDSRNTNFEARERYANWFAIEHGYRHSRS
ncbi:MAG: hypothetical protein O3A00_22485 [Planctomycetota bacterium]|nr:hypothetical protein [Planctomycetota bacterium]